MRANTTSSGRRVEYVFYHDAIESMQVTDHDIVATVTGLFLSNENTIGPAVDLLALVLREASRDRR